MIQPARPLPDAPLLSDNEPGAWELVNSEGPSPLVILCDHASNRIPQSLGDLGLSEQALSRHIAYDIGCDPLSRKLSVMFDAPLMLANYSRLVIDLNRHPGDGSSIPEVSDSTEIPGNRGMEPAEITRRENALFRPYHEQAELLLDRIAERGEDPIVCAIHSFTPIFRGFQRPWHIGVLWDRDQRLSTPLLERFRQEPGLCVGDNEPYHARNPVGYTMDIHGEHKGRHHVLLEIRQDLITDPDGVNHWAEIIHRNLEYTLRMSGLINRQ
jgi:predicted N-formylglutamate amidohydrolase